MLMVCFTAIVVCTGVGSLVLEHFHQAVKDDCEDGAEKGTQPVDPVVSRPYAGNNGRSERTSWVQGASREVNTYLFQPWGISGRVGRRIPASSAMNNASPMPIGAMKVALCFSAANMKMVRRSMKVKNISMNRPRVIDVSRLRVVFTDSGPGNSPDTTAAAAMAPSSCATISSKTFIQPSAPTRPMATVAWVMLAVASELTRLMVHTAGLNKPPLMRKKTQTVTAKEKPNANEMYNKDPTSMDRVPRRLFATCVAAKAKKRKRKVPTNSPRKEMKRWRALLGSHAKPARRDSPGRSGSSVYLGFMPGKTMELSEGRWWFMSATEGYQCKLVFVRD